MKINLKLIFILVLVLIICLLTLYIYKSNYSLETFQTYERIELKNAIKDKINIKQTFEGDKYIYTITHIPDIILASNDFIEIIGPNVTIKGDGEPFIVGDEYKGLIRNGDNSNPGSTDITIENIVVNRSDDKHLLAENAGAICQEYFGSKITKGVINIKGCSSSCNIGSGGGGICGLYFGYESEATFTIQNCYSTGKIGIDIGIASGGICGSNFGYNSLNTQITIQNCYSLGDIDIASGGICGSHFGNNSSCIFLINNCYSLGNIYEYGGGICGSEFGYMFKGEKITITNCLAMGNIDIGNYSGGILGYGAFFDVNNINVFEIKHCKYFNKDDNINNTFNNIIPNYIGEYDFDKDSNENSRNNGAFCYKNKFNWNNEAAEESLGQIKNEENINISNNIWIKYDDITELTEKKPWTLVNYQNQVTFPTLSQNVTCPTTTPTKTSPQQNENFPKISKSIIENIDVNNYKLLLTFNMSNFNIYNVKVTIDNVIFYESSMDQIDNNNFELIIPFDIYYNMKNYDRNIYISYRHSNEINTYVLNNQGLYFINDVECHQRNTSISNCNDVNKRLCNTAFNLNSSLNHDNCNYKLVHYSS